MPDTTDILASRNRPSLVQRGQETPGGDDITNVPLPDRTGPTQVPLSQDDTAPPALVPDVANIVLGVPEDTAANRMAPFIHDTTAKKKAQALRRLSSLAAISNPGLAHNLMQRAAIMDEESVRGSAVGLLSTVNDFNKAGRHQDSLEAIQLFVNREGVDPRLQEIALKLAEKTHRESKKLAFGRKFVQFLSDDGRIDQTERSGLAIGAFTDPDIDIDELATAFDIMASDEKVLTDPDKRVFNELLMENQAAGMSPAEASVDAFAKLQQLKESTKKQDLGDTLESVSLTLYDRNFVDLDQNERQRVRSTVYGEKIALARAQVGEQPVPAAISNTFSSAAESMSFLNEIRSLVGDHKFTGIFRGPFTRYVREKLGLTGAKEQQFLRAMRDLRDSVLRTRSGAAVNRSEREDIRRFTLHEDMPPKVFMNNLIGLARTLDRIQKRMATIARTPRRGLGDLIVEPEFDISISQDEEASDQTALPSVEGIEAISSGREFNAWSQGLSEEQKQAIRDNPELVDAIKKKRQQFME